VEGYRISGALTPHAGFGGNFHVYIWDRIDAKNKYDAGVDVGKEGKAPRGTLEIHGDGRNYSFKNMDLTFAELGATRRERFRVVEFRYDPDNKYDDKFDVSLDCDIKGKPAKGALEDDYLYSLPGADSEHLLEFRTLVAPNAQTVVRLTAMRTSAKSFVQQIIDVHNAKDRTLDFTIKFAPKDIEIKEGNLARMFVDETYGLMQRQPQRDLSEYVSGSEELSRFYLPALSASDIMAHDADARFRPEQLTPQTLETATLVFNSGAMRDLAKEIK
jgi:hypothetical protein